MSISAKSGFNRRHDGEQVCPSGVVTGAWGIERESGVGQCFAVLFNPSPLPVSGLVPDLSELVGVGQFAAAPLSGAPHCVPDVREVRTNRPFFISVVPGLAKPAESGVGQDEEPLSAVRSACL